jgi:hypothetical protein
MEGLPKLGKHCQRLPGIERDGGGHEPRRLPQRAPGTPRSYQILQIYYQYVYSDVGDSVLHSGKFIRMFP